MPQNRSTHVQERPGRAAAPCLRPPSSLAAPRRVAFMPATMSSFLFVFKSKSFVAMYREGHFGHIVSTAQDGLLEDRKHTDRVGYQANDLAKQRTCASRGQSARTPRVRAVRASYALAEAASPPPGTYRSLPPRSDRASIMRRRHSFMTTVTSASPAFPMLALPAWKSARALRFSFALRCVASSFPMFARATWMNALALRILCVLHHALSDTDPHGSWLLLQMTFRTICNMR